MGNYTVITAGSVDRQLLRHAAFLAQVSVPAAKRFRSAYEDLLDRIEANPYQFPYDTDPGLPAGLYRKALFSKWYKALFTVEGTVVYLDAVVDCRQSIDLDAL